MEDKVNRTWIISSNPEFYDLDGAFKKFNDIEWKSSVNYVVGDTVFIYVTKPIQKIRYKCTVSQIGITKANIDDSQFFLKGKPEDEYERVLLTKNAEYNSELLSIDKLQKQVDFKPPQKALACTDKKVGFYVRAVTDLLDSKEMDPYSHDASYKLVQETVNAYAKITDIALLDYQDLTLLFSMCLGTWKRSVDIKKNDVDASHLLYESKTMLKALLDESWERTENHEYENYYNCNFGMFGTGFQSFKGKTSDEDARAFVKLCVEIKDVDNEEEIFSKCEPLFSKGIKGLQAATVSQILHCFKPTVFPVLNGNMGYQNIFEKIGIRLTNSGLLVNYIDNCRRISKFRDKYFSIKNYRIFDVEAWKQLPAIDFDYTLSFLDKYAGVEYKNPEKTSDEDSKKLMKQIRECGQNSVDELRKLREELVKVFKFADEKPMINWLDGTRTKVRHYQWIRLHIAEYDNPNLFISVAPIKTDNKLAIEVNFDFSSQNATSNGDVILDRYYTYLFDSEHLGEGISLVGDKKDGSRVVLEDTKRTGVLSQTKSGIFNAIRPTVIIDYDETKTNEEYYCEVVEAVKRILPIYEYVAKNDWKYTPSLDEYNPRITVEQWVQILRENDPNTSKTIDLLKKMMRLGGRASCYRLQEVYGQDVYYYNRIGTSLGELVYEKTNCPRYFEDGKQRYYSIPFLGRNLEEDGKTHFEWKMRNELMEVFKQLGIQNEEVIHYDRTVQESVGDKAMNPQNIILYGPPGTGKTYSIKARVVNICDSVDTDDMEEAVIKERFDKLVSGGRVVFTTFHQSYGYEEFVEGIAPVIDKSQESQSDLQYTLKPGVFKLICDKARKDKNNHYVIVIDEINRGNISKIFGELITLIEESKREGNKDEVSVLLPYSQARFTVPNNLSIIGTMNTADRSIAMIDTALRRRFKFIEMMPQPEMLKDIKIQNIDLVKMLDIMNKRIERLYDREHTIGHAFFLLRKNDQNLENLAEIFKYKIIPLLQEYFYEDYSKISLVLGDNQKSDDSIRFIVKEEKPSIDELFGKNSGQDLPETYSINSAAFNNIDSYIGIYEKK